MNGLELRSLIVRSLRCQGFRIRAGQVLPPPDLNKEKLRDLHALAVQHRLERSRDGLVRIESRLLERLASGSEIVPEQIAPRLVEVKPDSDEELLFRYASLHWSIPVSSGYGRRIRFLVIDEQNGKLIGLFGLGDPVFSLGARDEWIGWTKEARRENLHHVMDAFVLGAVPPYSFLLCGKLVAMLIASNEVRNAFKRKYGGRAVGDQKKTAGRPAGTDHHNLGVGAILDLQPRQVRRTPLVSWCRFHPGFGRVSLLEWSIRGDFGVCGALLRTHGEAGAVGNGLPKQAGGRQKVPGQGRAIHGVALPWHPAGNLCDPSRPERPGVPAREAFEASMVRPIR